MEYEDIDSLKNSTIFTEISEDEPINFLIHEIIYSLICLIAISANSLIIYIIFRFSRMRTVPNILFANWVILDLWYVIYIPCSIVLANYVPLPQGYWCILFKAEIASLFGSIWFALAALQDWFMAIYFKKVSRTFRKYYKFVIVLIWAFILLNGVISNCDLVLTLESPTLFLSFLALLLIIIVLQSIRAVQKCRDKPFEHPTLILTLTTGFVIIMFPEYLHILIMTFTNTYHRWFGWIGSGIRFSSGILTFALMYNLDKDFHECLLRVLKRSASSEESNG